MKARLRFLTIPLCAVASLALAGNGTEKADVDRVMSTARESSQVMEHLDHLVNRIGSRLTSSDGLQTACEWTRDQFKSFGIENARLEKWGEFPVGFNRGPWTGRMVTPTEKALTFGTNSWTAGTKGPTKGHVVIAPENEEQLEKVKDKLPGAWVLAPPATRGGRGGRGGPGGGADLDDAARKKLEEERKKLEDFRAKVTATYEEAKIAGLVRSTSNDLILTGGNYQISYDKLPTIPSINLLKVQYDEIAALVKEGKPVTLEFDIRNYFKKGPIPLYNVIADIIGTEFPEEYVIVGGHIDSWDGATGTCDNGTGCSTTLEAARILMKSGVKPRRTIRFMLWSGEEQGLFGSKEYVAAHPELNKKISAVLVHDGGTNYLSGLGVPKAMKEDIDSAFAPLIGLDASMPFSIREVPGLRRGGGSDHDSFLAVGVPGFFWGQRGGRANYTHVHHTQFDTYDAAIPEYQKHSSIVVAIGSLGIANLDHLLSREGLMAPGGNTPTPRRNTGLRLEEMKVSEVTEGGPAEKAGFKTGDVVVKVAGKPVANVDEYREALMAATGSEIVIVVKRDGQEVELKLVFAAPAGQP